MVSICTPVRDTICAATTFDLIRLIKYSTDTLFTVSQGTILPNQRTDLVKNSLLANCSHILFIDADMRFPEDTIERLLKHDKDIIGANCRHRQSDKWTTGKSSKGKKGIKEVENIGFGVTMIKSEVFNKIPQPWFATPYDGFKFVGEDVFFCHKAKESGFKIYTDHDLSLEVKHIGVQEYG